MRDEDQEVFWLWGVRVEEGGSLAVLGRNSAELGSSCDCNTDGEKGCAVGLSLVAVCAGEVSSWLLRVATFAPALRAALSSLAN